LKAKEKACSPPVEARKPKQQIGHLEHSNTKLPVTVTTTEGTLLMEKEPNRPRTSVEAIEKPATQPLMLSLRVNPSSTVIAITNVEKKTIHTVSIDTRTDLPTTTQLMISQGNDIGNISLLREHPSVERPLTSRLRSMDLDESTVDSSCVRATDENTNDHDKGKFFSAVSLRSTEITRDDIM